MWTRDPNILNRTIAAWTFPAFNHPIKYLVFFYDIQSKLY